MRSARTRFEHVVSRYSRSGSQKWPVDALDPLCEQATALGVQLRQHRCEIRLILRPRVLRLEEQHDFRALVGNAVGGVLDQLVVGKRIDSSRRATQSSPS